MIDSVKFVSKSRNNFPFFVYPRTTFLPPEDPTLPPDPIRCHLLEIDQYLETFQFFSCTTKRHRLNYSTSLPELFEDDTSRLEKLANILSVL